MEYLDNIMEELLDEVKVENDATQKVVDAAKNIFNLTDEEIKGSYKFYSEKGEVVYYKVKFQRKGEDHKEIRYFSFDEEGEVVPKRNHAEIPYNLDKLTEGIENKRRIFITEGEKDADTLTDLGYIATSLKGIKEIDKSLFKGAKLHIIGDTGQAGEEYKKHIKEQLFEVASVYKEVKLFNVHLLGDNKDVTDWLEAGNTKEDLDECIYRSLNQKSLNSIIQDDRKIIKKRLVRMKEEEFIEEIQLTNFIIKQAVKITDIENPEDDGLTIRLKLQNGRKQITRFVPVNALNSIDTFRNTLNSLDFTFIEEKKALKYFKLWLSDYMIDGEERSLKGDGFYNVNDEIIFVNNDEVISKGKPINDLLSIGQPTIRFDYKELITDTELKEIIDTLKILYDEDKIFSVLGQIANYYYAAHAKTLGLKVSNLLITGTSGGGKSTLAENVIIPLLNYVGEILSAGGLTKFSYSKSLSNGNIPLIVDEFKPTQMSEATFKMHSDMLRNIYDRHAVVRGNKDQSITTYELKRPIILIGEEGYKGEQALIERSNIIELPRAGKSLEKKEALRLLQSNQHLLKKLGYSIAMKVLEVTPEQYFSLRKDVEAKILKENNELTGRVLNTTVDIVAGLRTINSLTSYKIEDIQKPVIKNICYSVLDEGNENDSISIGMLREFLTMIEEGDISKDYLHDFVNYTVKDGELRIGIRPRKIVEELQLKSKRLGSKEPLLNVSEFKKQLEQSDIFLLDSNKKAKRDKFRAGNTTDGKYINYYLLNTKTLEELNFSLDFVSDEALPEPIYTEKKVIDLFH